MVATCGAKKMVDAYVLMILYGNKLLVLWWLFMSASNQLTNQQTNQSAKRKDQTRIINQASYQLVNQHTTNKQSIKERNEKTIEQSNVNHKRSQ